MRLLYLQVVLVGGASRVPKIQTNLQRTVAALGNKAQVKKTVDLDRGIAMGESLNAISEGEVLESLIYSSMRRRCVEGQH